jgi:hypothetical protein
VIEWVKWAAKWLGIYLVSNLITVLGAMIAFPSIFEYREVTDSQLVDFGQKNAIEDYSSNYIAKLGIHPDSVNCEVLGREFDDVDVYGRVMCSVFDGGKIVLKRSYRMTVDVSNAGEVLGFEDHPIPDPEAK